MSEKLHHPVPHGKLRQLVQHCLTAVPKVETLEIAEVLLPGWAFAPRRRFDVSTRRLGDSRLLMSLPWEPSGNHNLLFHTLIRASRASRSDGTLESPSKVTCPRSIR